MNNHPSRPPAASSAPEEWPPDFSAQHQFHYQYQNLQHGQPETIPLPSQQQPSAYSTDFNLDSFLAADLNAMYAAQAAATAGGRSQEYLQPLSVPLHYQVGHSHHSIDLEQQRPHSHSIVSSGHYVPQVPSRPLSEGLHTSITPPLRPSCRYQVHYDRGEGASFQRAGTQTEQHQQHQFISHCQQYPQHPLNIHHHDHHHCSHVQPAAPTNNPCPLHPNNQLQPLYTSHQHPPVPQQQLSQQQLPQQPLPQQQLPQQQLPQQPVPQQQPSSSNQVLLYHQPPPVHSHLLPQQQLPQQRLPQQQLPQQPLVRRPLPQYHQSLVRQSEYIQPVMAKPTHIIFPPIIHELQKKDSSGSKQVLIPVPLPRTNNDNNSKDSPDLPTAPIPTLPPSSLPSLPSTPYIPEPILSQPPTAPTPVPGPSGYNPDSPDSPIRASCRNVDIEGIRRLRLFADRFKESRIRYEYSKQHVAQQISIRYNFEMTEQQLQQFESKALSFEEMSAMKTHLEKWLMDTLRNRGINETEIKQLSQWLTSFHQRRRRRTAIPVQTKKQLLKEFENNPKPSVKALKALAEKLGIRFEVVRVWFCNKRAKKKAGKDTGPEDDEEIEEELDSDDEGNSDVQSSQ
ncbi:PREDICTED: bromodomain-containing protein 4-like [Amphimedon queenslandica]|uniref:POU domain protein n=1 Tax=Amphimedon queenslandica TaxID=400682 RepID=A0A1X7TR99_AMPQE|nr:PREDICTED: bromodomain-containing protein 4-like [Amphimedon queenslandica]|eukprot:XP_019858268.1 PREDICTED: bromodomain-containing protein 4-like [Amphimedon queenslandica]